jgi:uncharacterized membrane protein YtjA (UPF0391 family)
MLWLALVCAILAIIFGFWGFAAMAWVGLKILFWIFVALFILSLLGSLWGPRRTYP